MLHLGPGDHHGHRIVATLPTVMAAASGMAAAHAARVLPRATAGVGVPASAGVKVRATGTACWLLDAWSWDHVIWLSLIMRIKYFILN